MLKFKFSKLVRDKIVEHQLACGTIPSYRKLSPNQHKDELIKKIIEESQEICQAQPSEIAMEIADVQQALDDLKDLYGLTDKNISDAQTIKNKKNGPFKKGLYVDHVEIDDNSEWVVYYRKNADRYPEMD